MTDLTPEQRVVRGDHARRALEEFLNPAFDAVIAVYTDRIEHLASTAPWESAKITALANATRIAKEVHGQIAALVNEGEYAKSTLIRAEKIEALTPARRRLASIGALW